VKGETWDCTPAAFPAPDAAEASDHYGQGLPGKPGSSPMERNTRHPLSLRLTPGVEPSNGTACPAKSTEPGAELGADCTEALPAAAPLRARRTDATDHGLLTAEAIERGLLSQRYWGGVLNEDETFTRKWGDAPYVMALLASGSGCRCHPQ
jgi:hypothetical protein